MSLYERTLEAIHEKKRPVCRQGVVTNGTLGGESEVTERHSEKNVPFVTRASEVETRLRFFSPIGGNSNYSFARASDKRDTLHQNEVNPTHGSSKVSLLSITPVDKRDSFESPLPKCPIVHGGPYPSECRYTAKFLVRTIKTGALPDPVVGCPLRRVCKLGRQMDEFDGGINHQDRTLTGEQPKCFNNPCQHAGYRQHDDIECKWCDLVQAPLIDMGSCTLGQWRRDGNGRPILNPKRKAETNGQRTQFQAVR